MAHKEARNPAKRKNLMGPGHVRLPGAPTRLAAVVGSGVVLTLFDRRRKRGGMSHFARPLREGGHSTPFYAAPAIVSLAEMLFEEGSRAGDLEACLFGGGDNPQARDYERDLGEKNVKVGREILARLRVRISEEDTGGNRARKVIFDTSTGESVVARVNHVRKDDWYPRLETAS